MHEGKTKYITNNNKQGKIKIEDTYIEKVDNYKYLSQIESMADMEEEMRTKITAGWKCFGRHKNESVQRMCDTNSSV